MQTALDLGEGMSVGVWVGGLVACIVGGNMEHGELPPPVL